MTENWDSYICRVNGELASIFLNLALRANAPIADKEWLLWVWVHLQNPRPDGLSDTGELETLIDLDERLSQRLLECCGAVLAGTITTQGRREFYFYGRSPGGFDSAVLSAVGEFHGYRFETGTQADPQWNQYLTVLYPSATDLQRMKVRNTQ